MVTEVEYDGVDPDANDSNLEPGDVYDDVPLADDAEPADANVEHVGGTEADDMDIYFPEGESK
jgi:hypothetical protein